MNIFVLHEDPRKAAQMMCDKHIPKMCVETAQMMASALRKHGATDNMMPLTKSGTPYKGGYANHPCTVWTGINQSNYNWLAEHGHELLYQYWVRFGKIHSCALPITKMIVMSRLLPEGELTDFARAFQKGSPEYDDLYDASKFTAVEAYRAYYIRGKAHFAKWEKGVSAPSWWYNVLDLPTIEVIG